MHNANMSFGSRLLIICHHPNKGLSVCRVMGPTQAPPGGHAAQTQSLGSVEVLLRYCSAEQSSALLQFWRGETSWKKRRKQISKLNCAFPQGSNNSTLTRSRQAAEPLTGLLFRSMKKSQPVGHFSHVTLGSSSFD